ILPPGFEKSAIGERANSSNEDVLMQGAVLDVRITKIRWYRSRIRNTALVYRFRTQECARHTDYCFVAIFAGSGMSGVSADQAMETTHQRVPSLISWKELMPRWNGFSPGSWRDS